jgi:hypothetical protein
MRTDVLIKPLFLKNFCLALLNLGMNFLERGAPRPFPKKFIHEISSTEFFSKLFEWQVGYHENHWSRSLYKTATKHF